MSARGTKKFTPKKEQKWAGEAFKKHQAEMKKKAGDFRIIGGRGTTSKKVSDIKETKIADTKGYYISTGRGTGKRKL